MKKILCIALFSMLVILGAAGAQAAVWYVDGHVSSSGAGNSWGTAFKTIGEAIANGTTVAGDEIWVRENTYTLSAPIDVDKAVYIYGGFDGTETQRDQRDWENNVTTVDGDDAVYHCFYIVTASPGGGLDGFTITGGNANGGVAPDFEGGGIYLNTTLFDIANCSFTDNYAVFGGAIYTYVTVYSSTDITNCSFTGNTADSGGAIYNNSGDPTISNCTFSGNSAHSGGAMYSRQNALPTISNCAFAGNDATVGSGGVIFNDGDSVDLTSVNCTFSGNTAATNGGAIFSLSSTATITNCTFTGNEANGVTSHGGAIAGTTGTASPTFTITNCILWGDSATTSGDEIYNDGSATITVTYSDVDGGYSGTGNINADPLLWDVTDPDPINWDLHLRSNSPCIDVGDNAAPDIPSTDFEGDPRILDGDRDGTDTVDMGADEVNFIYQCVTNSTELEDALYTAQYNGSDDVIQVVQGSYFGSFNYYTGEGHSITLEGGYTSGCAGRVVDPSTTVLDAGGTGRVLHVRDDNGGNITVDGFTIQNGVESVDGGGIYASSDAMTTAGNVTLTNNIIAGNTTSADGGGVYATSHAYTGQAGDVTITNNTIFGNNGTYGGGIAASSSTDSGTAGTVILTNNIVFGNDATYGGGIRAYSTSSSGTAGTVILTNNTITGNDADYGGGTQLFTTGSSGGSVNCYNNIIWGNTALSGGDIYLGGTGTTSGYNNDYSSIDGSWDNSGGPNIDADPLFVDTGDGDYHLKTTSPCIDKGFNTVPAIPAYDFEGEPRIADGDHNGTPTADMGADEVPAIWYVDGGISSSGDGTSWGTAKKTISEAITVASAGDEIWVKQGTYVLTSTITVNKIVGLYGGFAGTETARSQRDWQTNTTTVDGADSAHCFSVSDDAVIDGLTITRGYYSNGGGMYIGSATSPLIMNCTFTDNNAGTSGAAIYIYGTGSFPTIENCTFSNNSASSSMGGAIYNTLASPTISNCTFSAANSAPYGGAIGNVSADVTISDCTFSGNTATSGGGAIYNNNTTGTITGCTFTGNDVDATVGGGIANTSVSSLTISDCTFQGNSAHNGAGIHNSSSSPTITGCTFINNTADYSSSSSGGGIRNDNSSTPTITNCLFYNNSAEYLAGGILNYISSDATITNCTFYGNSADDGGAVANTLSNPTFTNCILWGDTAITSGDEIYVINGSPTFTYCDIEGGYTGTGNIDSNPLFKSVTDPDPLNWDLHLRSNSPCIDVGYNATPSLPSTDFEGNPRIINGTVDMGADEAAIIPIADPLSALCPDGLGFGEVATTSTRNLNLSINNTRGTDITVGTVTSPSSPFTRTVNNCGGVTLHPGDTCSITIQFAPSSTGTFYDSFNIPIDGDTRTIALSGIGVTGGSFETRGSTVSDPGAIPDVNATGTGDVTPTSPPVVEGPASTPSSTGTTPAGAPESPSVDTGATKNSASPAVISSLPPDMLREPEKQLISEEAQEPYDVMVFGEVKVGASDQLRITFSLKEGAAIPMGDIITPTSPSYVIVEDKCSGTLLDVGGECAVTVQFAPPTAQNFYDYFLIPTDDPEVGTLRINLEGIGITQ